MVRLPGAEDLDHGRQQAVGASAHVHRGAGQPYRIDADHRSSSRSQPAHSAAADGGQVTLK